MGLFASNVLSLSKVILGYSLALQQVRDQTGIDFGTKLGTITEFTWCKGIRAASTLLPRREVGSKNLSEPGGPGGRKGAIVLGL